jgi:demethylmenaquinone methyltransferase/2-methoxy-6-polyprenyl-1,4-benzoquinol methylase
MKTENEKQRFFDDVAAEFAGEGLSDEQGKIDWLLEQWGIKHGMTVLEPGCGAGQLTVRLAEAVGKEGQIIALDISEQMLSQTWKRIEDTGLRDRVSLHHCSLEEYDADPESVDMVVAYRVFPHLDDIPAALEVVARALKPGGSLFINHPEGREKINQFHMDIGGAVANDLIPHEEELREYLEAAGLRLQTLVDNDGIYHTRAVKPH